MKNAWILAAACLAAGTPALAGDRYGGSAGASATNANAALERCDRPYGTLALVEDQGGDWYQYLTSDLRLGSTVPLLRLFVQQSNCFVVVERGRAMDNMMQERALADSGEIREGSSFGKGQMVAADYTLNPSINFATSDAGGISGLLGAFGGKAARAGAVLGGVKFKQASTLLMLVDNRSGVQLAAAEGQARKADFNLGALAGGRGALGGVSGYTRTPEGKMLAQAFADAYNQMVVSLRGYQAQGVEGGLGKGGTLEVGN